MTLTDTSDLDAGTRVIATEALRGVPEGTPGKLGRRVGLNLARYRVAFDNDVDLTSVAHTKLVVEDEWDDLLADREAAESAAADEEAAAATATEPADDGPATDGKADSGATSAADDRLAALLAKSKAARSSKEG